MASRNNPYQRDPNLAKAFDNIAALFAPPSGTDAAGFAAAGLNNTKRQQLEWLFNNAADPMAATKSALTGVAAYGNTAEGFNKTDATNRRGQDITAATARENNIRSNATDFAKTRYGAISEGQILPELPQSVAQLYGVPAAPAQAGVLKLGQNQTAVMPDGTTATGINRPQTMDEWQAQQAERMRQAGTLPDTTLVDIIRGKQTPAFTLGPDGKTPVYVDPGKAMREGLPAAAAPSSTPVKRDTGTAFIGDKQIPVTRSPDGLQWVDPNGVPVPEGARVTNMPTPQGSLDQVGATTANNTESNRLAATIVSTNDMLNKYEELLKNNPAIIGVPGSIRGMAQDAVSTLSELGAAFGGLAPDAKVSLDQVQGLAQKLAPTRDPNIQIARSLAMSLAYQDAQLQNPSGEVSRQAFERSYEKLTGGALRNNQSALESVQGMRMLMDSKLKQVEALRKPGSVVMPAPTPPPAPGGVERWERGPDGQLRKVAQ